MFIDRTIYASSKTSSKINNTASSTEIEVILVGIKLPKYLCFRNFAVEQTGNKSYQVHVLHCNMSIFLLKNGGFLISHGIVKLQHNHIRYFFTIDRIKRKEIRVE